MITWTLMGSFWDGRIDDTLVVSVFKRATGWFYRFHGQRPRGPHYSDQQAMLSADQSLTEKE